MSRVRTYLQLTDWLAKFSHVITAPDGHAVDRLAFDLHVAGRRSLFSAGWSVSFRVSRTLCGFLMFRDQRAEMQHMRASATLNKLEVRT